MLAAKMGPTIAFFAIALAAAALPIATSQSDSDNGCLSPVNINFTSVDPSSYDFQSVRVPEASGMDHLYSIVTHFASLVAKPGIPKELLEDDRLFKDPVSIALTRWKDFPYVFMGLLILLAVGLFLALVVPFVGVLVLCCRCCCKRCGGAENVPEGKGDATKRGWRGVLLFILAVVLLFAVVCAFVTNAFVPAAVVKLPDSINHSVHDVVVVVNRTKDDVDHLLVKNYAEFKFQFEQRLNVCTHQVGDDVSGIITRSPAFQLKHVADNVEKLSLEVDNITAVAKEAKDVMTNIEKSVESVKKSVEEASKKCKEKSGGSTCDDIEKHKKDLEFKFETVNVDKIQKAKDDIDKLEPAKLKSEVEKALDTEERRKDIMQKVNTATEEIRTKLNDVEKTLRDTSSKFDLQLISNPNVLDVTSIRDTFEEANKYVTYYGYVTLAIACVLAFVLACYVLGLTWGGCGSREGSCNRKTGGSCLTTGAVLFVLAFFVPMVLSTLILALGIMGQRGVCDIARDPGSEQSRLLIGQVAQAASKEVAQINATTIEEIIVRFSECRNKSYSLFQLLGKELVMNITRQAAGGQAGKGSVDWLWGEGDVAQIDIDQGIKDFEKTINDINVDNIVPKQVDDRIEQLRSFNINRRDLSDLKTKVNDAHLKFNLAEVLTKMEEFKSGKTGEVLTLLNNVTDELKKLQGFIGTLEQLKGVVVPSIGRVESLLAINGTDLNEYAYKIIQDAKNQLKEDVVRTIESARKYKDKFLEMVNEYLNHTRRGVEENVGDCRALYGVYSAAVSSVCDDVLLPLNGYWFSVAAFLVVGIPAVMFALCLASLYARVDPATLYLDPLSPVDSDHVSGGSYMDSDTIPLARLKKLPQQNGRDNRGYDNHPYQRGVNHKRRHTGGNSAVVNRASYDSRDGYYHDISPEYREHPVAPHHRPVTSPAIAYSPAPAYHYSRDPGIPHYAKGYESAPPPAARHSGDWESNQFAKPPPYYYPGS
ncbi:prominin-1-A-like isoform X1 [Dermacentor variabilis]|uniref:prominin-1-A-like isoform X1 n=1 Tax=Dermacentor variabilis TaxID=34621 RepID=UPI003F5BC302